MSDKLLSANKAAAEMLGHKNIDEKFGVVYYDYAHKSHNKMHRNPFSIKNPADRDAVEQVLGDKHQISICPNGQGSWFWYNGFTDEHGKDGTRIEAYIAAVLAVEGL